MRMFWRQIRRWLHDSPLKPACPPRRKSRLGFDFLEERSTPANLAFTSAALVDAAGNTIISPQTGEQVLLKVTWAATDLAPTDAYQVGVTVGGIALDSQTFTGSTNGTRTTTLSGWYATPGANNYQVVIDSHGTVTETSETDNSSGSVTFSTALPTSLPTKFVFPVTVTTQTFADWVITSYVDLDPNFGAVKDYTNGPFAIDGSTGVDITIPTFNAQDRGINRVLAAASGAVELISDGAADRQDAGSTDAPNSILINHGNGWKTQYIGLALNSLTVKVGDAVAQGQTIGLVGSSGNSFAPHLTFIVTHNGVPVETNLDAVNYWRTPLAYQGTFSTIVLDQGITNYAPHSDLLEKPVGTTTFPTTQNWDAYYYARINYLNADDVVSVAWTAPGGATALTSTHTASARAVNVPLVFNLPAAAYQATPGLWRAVITVNGQAAASTTQTFNVVATGGAPNFRVTAAGEYIQTGRSSPIEFGSAPVGGSGNTQTFVITNTGAASLQISNVTIPAGFSLAGPVPSNPTTLLPGNPLTFNVMMNTATAGDRTGALRFDTSLNGTNSIYLRGLVSGTAVVGAPILFFPGPAAISFPSTSPFLLEPGAIVADANSANFRNGKLVVEFLNVVNTENNLAVRNEGTGVGQIGVNGANITYNFSGAPVVIGTQAAVAGTSLTITFNQTANTAAVQALIRNITYADSAATPTTGIRYIRFSLIDDTTNVSNSAIKGVYPAAAPGFSSLITLTESAGTTNAVEGGASDSYNIVLTTNPTTNVVINILAITQVTTSVNTLTFTPSNWNVPQTVTVSAIDDTLAEGLHSGAITHGVASGDTRFQSIAIPLVSPSITDNDKGVVVTQSGGSTNVSEAGATDSISLSLGTAPTASVTVTLTPNPMVNVSNAAFVFDAANWNIPQTVTIGANDDGFVQGTHLGSIAVNTTSSDANYNALVTPPISVSIADNDVAGVRFTPVGGVLVTTEGGGTAAYTAVLTSQPTASVTINITGDAAVTTNPSSITFTPANWNIAQTVTVIAVNDFIAQGLHTGQISHSITSTDPAFAALNGSLATLPVTVNDNDVVGILVTESGNSTDVIVGGASDTISFVLTSQPTSDVAINVNIPDGFTTVSPAPLIITPANWNVPQILTVTAETNVTPEALRTSTLNFLVGSNDPKYGDPSNPAVNPAPISVSVTNNDLPTVILTTNPGGVVVSEAGQTDTYTIALSLEPLPGAIVTVNLTPGAQLFTDVPSVTFTSANYNVPQTVTVSATHDLIASGTHLATIGHSVTTSGASDVRYEGLIGPNLVVTITDIDTAGVSIAQSGGSTDVTEGGNNDVLTVVLTSQPTAPVTLNAVPDSNLFAGPGFLTFTASNWFTPQTILIAAADDTQIQGPHTGVVSFTVDSTDPFYDGLAIPDLTANITDNDALGIIINQTNSSTEVTEGGPADTYTVVLTAQPFADVIIDLTPGNFIDISPIKLTFTPANWNIPKTVSVVAVDDIVANGVRNSTISFAASSADSRYNGLSIGNVAITVNDNDTATVRFQDAGPGTALTEGGSTTPIQVTLASQPSGNVVVTLNPGVYLTVDATTVTFTSLNWNIPQTVNVGALDNQIAEGTHTGILSAITSSTDPKYNPASVAPKLIPVTDNDTAGVTFTPTTGTVAVTEGIGSDSYAVVLTSRPTADVTVVPPANSRLVFAPGALVFSPQNWNIPQAFQVTATDDKVAGGNQTFSIQHTLTTTDSVYAALAVPALPIDIVENDFVGIVIFPPSGVNLAEGAPGVSYTVNLNSQPTADVVVTLVGDISVTADVATLTFTPQNWDIPQAVTAIAIDNDVPQGIHNGFVGHVASSTDAGYDGFIGPDLIATVTDNDFGIVLNPARRSGTAVAEGEPGDTYTVSLSLPPTADVTVTINPESPLRVSSSVLTFTPANWDVPQTITVTAPNQFQTFPPRQLGIQHTDASLDPNYDGDTRTLPVTLTASRPDIIGRDQNGIWTINHNTGSSFVQEQPIFWNESVRWVDVRAADVNGDGRQDFVGRVLESGEIWVALSQGTNGYVNQHWTTWSTAVTWVDVIAADFNDDGKQDILGRAKEYGEWWVALSTGTTFDNQKYATWSTHVTWVDVLGGDFDNDGRNEIAGRALEIGEWWVGLSTPSAGTGFHFEATKWATWSTAVTWADVRVGDFDGDSRDDITGRALQFGEWWTALSTGSAFVSEKWATWNPNVVWSYVNVGDFNGDLKIDILGREGNNIWVGLSTGSAFTTDLWASEIPIDFTDLFSAFDYTGDGYSDFVGRAKSSGQWFVYAAKAGQATFQSPVLWTTWLPTSKYKDVLNAYTL
jgi:murein DD-endopeptidase MepM/ murein hydrolase activator NlpD